MTSFTFHAKGSWHGSWTGQGEIHTQGFHEKIAIDKSMNGLGMGTNPDELLLSALCSCYMMTLGIRLNHDNIPYENIQINSKGIVKKKDGLHFEKIELYPVLILKEKPTEQFEKDLYEMMYHAEFDCMIAKALKNNVTISINPEVTHI
ncbi:hypothetical protein GMB86_00665 [Terrilactibacillus sp. BCM23-1]|uniref:OsmC family peroxiredoxin n=1 Tax=Terrilactibacillus tamarindi TaxID=2599694 RepID=A0A6N8CNU8_9BACI|nr:OsmC family protein [Terrilactibacillus tamarindi]MTT30525.1 hypothetical protein [Terrilactibacillus tamarindi]